MKWPVHLISGMLVAFSLQDPGRADELHDAVIAGKADAVEALLIAGADVNAPGDLGSPLHLAAFDGNVEIARLLIAKQADVNARHEADGARPLHVAANYNHATLAALLLDNGADPTVRDPRGLTAADRAERNAMFEVAALLRERE